MTRVTEFPQRTTSPPATEQPTQEPLPRGVVQAFAPLHRRAFGIATGTAAALLVFVATALSQYHPPEDQYIILLGQFFYGYTVSWVGALIGAAWAFVVGWVAGWFTAFCRNLVLAVVIFTTRTRAELQATRDFLDHI